jgi:hypothetical protein
VVEAGKRQGEAHCVSIHGIRASSGSRGGRLGNRLLVLIVLALLSSITSSVALVVTFKYVRRWRFKVAIRGVGSMPGAVAVVGAAGSGCLGAGRLRVGSMGGRGGRGRQAQYQGEAHCTSSHGIRGGFRESGGGGLEGKTKARRAYGGEGDDGARYRRCQVKGVPGKGIGERARRVHRVRKRGGNERGPRGARGNFGAVAKHGVSFHSRCRRVRRRVGSLGPRALPPLLRWRQHAPVYKGQQRALGCDGGGPYSGRRVQGGLCCWKEQHARENPVEQR